MPDSRRARIYTLARFVSVLVAASTVVASVFRMTYVELISVEIPQRHAAEIGTAGGTQCSAQPWHTCSAQPTAHECPGVDTQYSSGAADGLTVADSYARMHIAVACDNQGVVRDCVLRSVDWDSRRHAATTWSEGETSTGAVRDRE